MIDGVLREASPVWIGLADGDHKIDHGLSKCNGPLDDLFGPFDKKISHGPCSDQERKESNDVGVMGSPMVSILEEVIEFMIAKLKYHNSEEDKDEDASKSRS
ncbi:hypothetical protein Drorol1_Dr00019250 [Drosera rotundifolia]